MVVLLVTMASSVSCGDESPLDRGPSQISAGGRLSACARAASAYSQHKQFKQVTPDRFQSAAAPLRATIDDFGRDRTVTSIHSVNREAL